MTRSNYLEKVAHIINYDALIVDRASRGWQPYFLNFMFKFMPGNASTKKQIMGGEVQRAYSILATNVVRKPHSPSWIDLLPIFIGCPDLPVAKNKKVSPWEPVVNDGWHFNGCLLLPPVDKCRIKGHLQFHFNDNKKLYFPGDHKLHRIYADQLTSAMIADYALKQYKRGNVSSDDILILPRTRSEVKQHSDGNNHVRSNQTNSQIFRQNETVNNSRIVCRIVRQDAGEKDMLKLESKKQNEKPAVHRSYALVSEIDNYWNGSTVAYDEDMAGQPDITNRQINELIGIFKEMRRRSRSAIEELRTLRK